MFSSQKQEGISGKVASVPDIYQVLSSGTLIIDTVLSSTPCPCKNCGSYWTIQNYFIRPKHSIAKSFQAALTTIIRTLKDLKSYFLSSKNSEEAELLTTEMSVSYFHLTKHVLPM